MASILQLLCVATLAMVVYGQGPMARLDSFEVRLNQLTARLTGLTDQLDAATNAQNQGASRIRRLHRRLDGIPGAKRCPDGQFFCGNAQCISNLLVCDGTPECANGRDEQVCNTPFQIGSQANGVILLDQCDKVTSIGLRMTDARTVTSINPVSFFGGAIPMTWMYTRNFSDGRGTRASIAVPSQGTFYPATQSMTSDIQLQGMNRLQLSCGLFFGNRIRCTARRMTPENSPVCFDAVYKI